ncbi:helix-turn-helix domain-containing protein [Leucobacter ruminantium]|uniref:Helix-turn-helix domain-containing protein n=1 Tax=Leucobacter ruminantium TaxID=1289170 RepID=A0A939S0H1_9MICO|nr:helix-turn-helix domain-containing protein [Leucobacter ruminantium]MBO1806514.1 helix-turn-helix domain-containing protein [Leucobacter ruminantium]
MRPIHPTAGGVPVRIGARLRASRLAQGLTLEQLAQASGLTKGFISRVERDETMPSVPTLVQVCQALSLPVGSLFEEPEMQLIPLADAPRINMGGTGADERLVTPRSEDRVQLLRSSLAADASGGDALYTVNCSVESVHVVSGELQIIFSDRQVPLTAGDTLTFPGRTPHSWRAGREGAEIFWVLSPAAWSGSA